jgi:hypothetical protein
MPAPKKGDSPLRWCLPPPDSWRTPIGRALAQMASPGAELKAQNARLQGQLASQASQIDELKKMLMAQQPVPAQAQQLASAKASALAAPAQAVARVAPVAPSQTAAAAAPASETPVVRSRAPTGDRANIAGDSLLQLIEQCKRKQMLDPEFPIGPRSLLAPMKAQVEATVVEVASEGDDDEPLFKKMKTAEVFVTRLNPPQQSLSKSVM